VPMTDGVLSKQYVMNTRNGNWTVYTKWNASSLASFGGDLYFGAVTGGVVNKVTGSSDNGEDITAIANGAFVYPTAAQLTNMYTGIRPKMQGEDTVTGVVGVDTDFVLRSLIGASVPIINDVSTTPWGSDWGSPWGSASGARPQWFSITGEGKSVSVRLRATSQSANLRWFATDVLFKPGGIR